MTERKAHSIPYRPDLDGLRAIAVFLVLLFHCQFPYSGGGFVGVDVFFVISGFLITSLILADLGDGVFSFATFYKRRIRRLLPALLVTILVSLVAAAVIMTPEHQVDAAKSGAMATVSLSNFYFAKVASYFDSSAHEKPFLHMWSLSLEEQFYIFWPAAIFLLYRWKRRKAVAWFVLAGIPIGLAISQFWIAKNPNHAYFLLPTRGFQFLMGAACIWLARIPVRSKILSEAIGISGVLLILVSAVFFSDKTPFPGFAAAVPSLGAMLVIWQGSQFALQRVLGSRVMVWFGRISYSTYLVHWPIIVFWLYLSIEPLTLVDKIFLFLLSVVAGQLLDSMVAQRFRYARPGASNWSFAAAQVSLIGLIGIISGAVIATRGLPERFALVPKVADYRNQSVFPFLRDFGDGVLHLHPQGQRHVLIFGDSMAQNYIPVLLQMNGIRDARVDIVSRGGCVLAQDAVLINYGSPDRECLKLRNYLYALDDRYDLIVWSQNWVSYNESLYWQAAGTAPRQAFSGAVDFNGWRDGIDRTLNHFEPLAAKIVVIGPPVVVQVNPILQRIGPVTNISGIAAQLNQMRELPVQNRASVDDGIRALVASKPNTLYIDPRAIICSDGTCRLSQGKYSYYLDSIHNTAAAMPMLQTGLGHAGLQF